MAGLLSTQPETTVGSADERRRDDRRLTSKDTGKGKERAGKVEM